MTTSYKYQGLIAPCGMNCGICMAYLREKNKCPGCRGGSENKSYSCLNCIIINCMELKKKNSKFCFACEKFPCTRMKQLDKRYRTKYRMSMIENLENIEKFGIRKFIGKEKKRWTKNNKIFCVHNKKYFNLKLLVSLKVSICQIILGLKSIDLEI